MTRKSSSGNNVTEAADSNVAPSLQFDRAWHQSRWRSGLRKKLSAWFAENAREMPWRSDPTPYHVWVSEIMLQQTQVATVLPYYERWMRAFPSVHDLAEADESVLMRHWEGLGYYRRVRSMHAAAKKIVAEHGGKFPLTYEEVVALPGVGRYTAGAVLSISNDQKLPVLEGNTQRVYSRLIALRQPPTEKAANSLLWEFATKMLPPKGSGQFNQAAMELGALVCTPRNPSCGTCPLKRHCGANRLNLQDQIPGKIKRIRYEDRTEYALIITREIGGSEHYLARPLPDGGRWAGLWDFPRCTQDSVESVEAAADWLAREIGHAVAPGIRLQTLRHAVTKYRISLHVHQAFLAAEGATSTDEQANPDGTPPAPWRWVTLGQMSTLPMSVTGRKIVEFLSVQDQSLLPLS